MQNSIIINKKLHPGIDDFTNNVLAKYVNRFLPIEEEVMEKQEIKPNPILFFLRPKSKSKRVSRSDTNVNTNLVRNKRITRSDQNISEIGRYSLREVVTNRESLIDFSFYCVQRHAQENICFYLDVELFELTATNETMIDSATIIMNTYLMNNSLHSVNLGHEIKATIFDHFLNSRVHKKIFSVAKQEILFLIQGDLIPNWMESVN